MSVYRIHPAGGRLRPADWLALAGEAETNADGFVYLTENSGVELRAVKTQPAAAVAGLRCVPVVAAPLSARARDLAAELAGALSADGVPDGMAVIGVTEAQQAALPSADILVELLDSAAHITVAGQRVHSAVPQEDIARLIQQVWQERPQSRPTRPLAPACDQPIGWLPHADAPGQVTLGARVPEDAIPAAYAEMIGRMEVATTVTPWGGLVFHDLPEGDADVVLRFLAPRGFIFDAHSPLLETPQP